MKQRQPEKDNFTSPGWPLDSGRMKTFNKICQWLENAAELNTLQKVQQNMSVVRGRHTVVHITGSTTKVGRNVK